MKRLSLTIFFLVYITCVIPIINKVHAAFPLTVMTYNINRENANNDAYWVDSKMKALANFLKDNQIDIVGLQEVHDWENGPTASSWNLKYDDADILDGYLDKIGYPMYLIAPPYVPKTGVDFRPVIFSKYPEIPGSYAQYRNKENGNRHVITSMFSTPQGNIRIFNLHLWHGSDTCKQFDWVQWGIVNPLYQDNPNILVLGDFNLKLLRMPYEICGIPVQQRWNILCPNLNCGVLDKELTIDFIITPKISNFNQVSGGATGQIWVPEYKNWLSDHPYYTVKLVNKILPSIEVEKYGDMNNDNKLNLADVLLLIQKILN